MIKTYTGNMRLIVAEDKILFVSDYLGLKDGCKQ